MTMKYSKCKKLAIQDKTTTNKIKCYHESAAKAKQKKCRRTSDLCVWLLVNLLCVPRINICAIIIVVVLRFFSPLYVIMTLEYTHKNSCMRT